MKSIAEGGGEGAIALVEAHDGDLDRIVLSSDATLTLHLSSLPVYSRVEGSKTRLEVWLYEAEIAFKNLSGLTVVGMMRPSDSISDLELADGGQGVELKALLTPCAITALRLVLGGSGAELTASCTSGKLSLLRAERFLEFWDEPSK